MNYKKNISIAIIVLIVILMALPIYHLTATDFYSSEALSKWRVSKVDSFTIRFTHSVMLTPVFETYRINEQLEFILTETVFYSYGAGLPENTIYDFEMIEKGFRIYNINQKIDPLVYRTGASIANHTLIINNIEIPFLAFSKPQTAVEFKTKSRPLIVFLYEEVLTWISKIKRV